MDNFLYCASLKTKAGTKWGYINSKGIFIIDPIFEFANDFQNNQLAIVKSKGKYGCINVNGEFVIPPTFDSINDFQEERATAVLKNNFYVINETGQIVTKRPYNFIAMYQEGRALFSTVDTVGNYRYGYLNRDGDEIILAQFENGTDFKDGIAVVKPPNQRYALIDLQGNVLHQYPYFYVGNYGDHLLSFQRNMGEKYGYMTVDGQIMIGPKFSVALPFENGHAIVNEASEKENKYGFIDQRGNYVIQPSFHDMLVVGENRLALGKAIDSEKPFIGSLYAIANWRGEILSEFLFTYISKFSQGVAAVSTSKKAYFIDRLGNRARGLPAVIGADSVTLIGALIRVMKNNRVAYLDRKGNIIWKQNTIIPLSNRYRVIEKKYEPNKDFLVYYPQLDGMKNNMVEAAVNKKLRQLSNLKKIKETEQLDYSFGGDFNVTFFKKNLLVIELFGYEYYFGAAHGMPSKIYALINMINGSFYQLADLFKKESNYIEKLNKIIEEKISNDPEYDYVFPGAFKGIKQDQPFYVDETNLYIFFTPYEIGPYAAGFPTFTIAFAEIIDAINEKSEFWLAFH